MTDKAGTALLDRAIDMLHQALAPHAVVTETEVDAIPGARWVDLGWHIPSSESRPHVRLHLVIADDAATADHLPETAWVLSGRAPAGERERLRQRGTSFIHPASGTVYLAGPALLVDRVVARSRATRDISGAATIDPFADRPSRVIRVLLRSALSPSPRPWGVRELAATADVDRTTTSRVLERLEGWRLVERARRPGARGRALAVRLLDPVALLERWGASYDWTSNARLAVHAPMGSVTRFLERLPERLPDVRWALTLQAGAALLAPHAEWDRLHVYVDVADDTELRDVAVRHGWPTGEDGRLVLMRPHYRASLWNEVNHIHGKPVVGIAQLLLDLWRYPVRGREQAEHLLELRHRLPPTLFRAEATDA